MKKIYSTLSLIALFVGANAQNAAIRNSNLIENEAVINRNLKDVAAVSTSTVVRLYPPGINPASTCTLSSGLSITTGFQAGTNSYKDKEFSQMYDLTKYSLTTPASISTVVVEFAATGTGTGSVVSKIYSDNLGTPSALLGTSAPVSVTNCATTTTFTFSSAVSITSNKFHVSVELPANYAYTSYTVNGTNLGVIMAKNCADDYTTTATYVRQSDNSWYAFPASYGLQKVTFGIEPIVSASISTDISENQKLNNTFRIFPNPATNQLSINFLQNQKSVNLINIFDVTGKLVLSSSVQDKLSSNNTITLDLSNLNSGIYMVEAKTDDISVFDKVMISK